MMNRLRRWIQVAWCKLGIWHHRVVHISRTRCTWGVFAFEVFRGGWWLSGRGFCVPVITLVRIVVAFFSHGEICIDRVIKNAITADQNWNDSLRTGSTTLPCLDAGVSSALSFLSSPSSGILLAIGLDTYSLLMSKVVLLNGDMDEYMLA